MRTSLCVLCGSLFFAGCAGVPGLPPAGSLGRGRTQGGQVVVTHRALTGRLRAPHGKLPELGRPLGTDKLAPGLGLAWILDEGAARLVVGLAASRYSGKGDLSNTGSSWQGAALSGSVRTRVDLARLDLVLEDGSSLRGPWGSIMEYGLSLARTQWRVGFEGSQVVLGRSDWSLAPWLGAGTRVAPWRAPLSLGFGARLGLLPDGSTVSDPLDWMGAWRVDLSWNGDGGGWRMGSWRLAYGRDILLVKAEGRGTSGLYEETGYRFTWTWFF